MSNLRTWLFLLLAGLTACGEAPQPSPEFGVRADGTLEFVAEDGSVLHTVTVEIADTQETRQRGLMNRRGIELSEGMLFIFPRPDSLSFWMRNTAIPLDIIFIDEALNITNISRRTRPLSDDYIKSSAPAQYVVELRGGVAERFGIDESASVRWQQNNAD